MNPNVVTETMLAPSCTSSMLSSLPIPLPSPMQALSDTIHALIAQQAGSEDQSMGNDSGMGDEQDVLSYPQIEVPACCAINSLQQSLDSSMDPMVHCGSQPKLRVKKKKGPT